MPRLRPLTILVFIASFLVLMNQFRPYLFPNPQIAKSPSVVVPGATWTSPSTGHHVQAHGAGIIQVDNTYYLIGEDRSNGTSFHSINCYRSKDLVQWYYVGKLLTAGSGDLGPDRVVERPKVIYNERTKAYVMYMHIDDPEYKEAKVGIATSTRGVCEPYTYLRSFRPLDSESRDITLFKDHDGQGYLITEDRPHGLHINLLSSDYLTVEKRIHTFPEHLESPALVYLPRTGQYVMLGSYLTGWKANDNVYSQSSSLIGPWSNWQKFAPANSDTLHSQTSFVLPIGVSKAEDKGMLIYMGDRWDSKNLAASTYIWYPLDFDYTTSTLQMEDHRIWSFDQKSAKWQNQDLLVPTIPAEQATLVGHSKVVTCKLCTTGTGVELVDSGVVFKNIESSGTIATILIHYFLPGKTEKIGTTKVNDGQWLLTAFLPTQDLTTDGKTNGPFTTTLVTRLNPGKNSIQVQGVGSFGLIIDSIEVITP